MVEIRLDEKWILSSDEKQWILGHYKTGNNGLRFTAKYFFSDLAMLVKHYFGMKIRGSHCRDIQDLVEEIQQTRKAIEVQLSSFTALTK